MGSDPATAHAAALPGTVAPGHRSGSAASPESSAGPARLGNRRAARAAPGRPQVFPEAGARRVASDRTAAIRCCQVLFDATPGVLAARGPDPGPGVDRLTRATRERAVDDAIAALNAAEAARRMLGVGQPPRPARGQRSPESEREAKAAMLARLHLSRPEAGGRAQPLTGAALITLRVRPSALTAAGRAALGTILREAGVEATVAAGATAGATAGAEAGAGVPCAGGGGVRVGVEPGVRTPGRG